MDITYAITLKEIIERLSLNTTVLNLVPSFTYPNIQQEGTRKEFDKIINSDKTEYMLYRTALDNFMEVITHALIIVMAKDNNLSLKIDETFYNKSDYDRLTLQYVSSAPWALEGFYDIYNETVYSNTEVNNEIIEELGLIAKEIFKECNNAVSVIIDSSKSMITLHTKGELVSCTQEKNPIR